MEIVLVRPETRIPSSPKLKTNAKYSLGLGFEHVVLHGHCLPKSFVRSTPLFQEPICGASLVVLWEPGHGFGTVCRSEGITTEPKGSVSSHGLWLLVFS